VIAERQSEFTVMLRLRNHGPSAWSSQGQCPVQLRACWRTSRKKPTDRTDAIVGLPWAVHPGESLDIPATLPAPDAVGQFLLEVVPEQLGGPAFTLVNGKPAWIDVQVVAPAVEEIDYHKVYATANLQQDYWTVVGPPTREEFHRLAKVKLGQLQEQGLTSDSHVLDVGCGTGQLAAALHDYLSDRGLYFGTDVGPEAIDFCKRQYPRSNFHFAVNEFTEIPVGSHRFDIACFFSVFTHTYPDETVLLLAETARVLKPGGFILGDIFTSPLTDRCAGNRGAVELNREHFLRLVDLAGLNVEVASSWAWKQHGRREVLRFTKR
jgi:SAM-dependent methyltransferase